MSSSNHDVAATAAAVATLRSTVAIRERAQFLLANARAGKSRWFSVDDSKMHDIAEMVVGVTKERYPSLEIPYHSRWRHFEAGGVDRPAQLLKLLGGASKSVIARAQIDLAVVSVLLDAGAGPEWRYVESASGQTFTRSEGLGVATFHAFTAGLFSSDKNNPLQVDATGLRSLVTADLAEAMQVREGNALVGLEGRATLMRRLGETLLMSPETYGAEGRPGRMFDLLTNSHEHGIPPTAEVTAHAILSTLLITLSPIWPMNNMIGNEHLGDCWKHQDVPGEGLTQGWMPFHKLSQWLTYSLLEPFIWAGVHVRGIDALTGLPEYRNGGLFLDGGVIHPLDNAMLTKPHKAGDEFIVEWRALTIALLDEIAPMVREHLGHSAEKMPLACVLEGGTWATGRALAQKLIGGSPPLNIESDGTVF